MKTRNGKIARLPKHLRDEVNQRLENGEDGESILKWLNKTVPCKEMLAKYFDGKPINKQNLSDWKQGGYQEWLRNQEARERVRVMVEQAEDLEGETQGPTLADRLATVLTLQLIDMTRQLESVTDPGERWKQTKEILRELHRLRREDHHARQIRLAREKWNAEEMDKEAEEDRKQDEARKKWLLDTARAHRDLPLMAQLTGGGRYGWKWAHWEMCVKQDLPMPSWWDPKRPRFEIPPEPGAKSNVQSPMSKAGDNGSVKASQGESRSENEVPSSKNTNSKENPRTNIKEEDDYENEPPSSEYGAPRGDSGVDRATDTGIPSSSAMKEIINQKMKEAE